MICDHAWIFQHVVYSDGYQLPGSSAKERVYEDAYYCEGTDFDCQAAFKAGAASRDAAIVSQR